MKTILSSFALATILSSPLAASAAQTPVTTDASRATATVAMQQNGPSPSAKRADDRQAINRLEMQSRQLGPTN